jgi:hypothetical protein
LVGVLLPEFYLGRSVLKGKIAPLSITIYAGMCGEQEWKDLNSEVAVFHECSA